MFLYQVSCFQNRNFRHTFPTLFARKRAPCTNHFNIVFHMTWNKWQRFRALRAGFSKWSVFRGLVFSQVQASGFFCWYITNWSSYCESIFSRVKMICKDERHTLRKNAKEGHATTSFCQSTICIRNNLIDLSVTKSVYFWTRSKLLWRETLWKESSICKVIDLQTVDNKKGQRRW